MFNGDLNLWWWQFNEISMFVEKVLLTRGCELSSCLSCILFGISYCNWNVGQRLVNEKESVLLYGVSNW